MSFIYLASPYRHPDRKIVEDRVFRTERFTIKKATQGYIIYSPIATWHHLVVTYNAIVDESHWVNMDFGMLSKASAMWVLCLEGWEHSLGISSELEFAHKCFIPTKHVTEDE